MQLGGDGIPAAGDEEEPPAAEVRAVAAAGDAVPACSFLLGTALARPLACREQSTRRALGGPARGCTSSSSTTATRWPTRPTAPTRKTHLDQAKRIAKGMIDTLQSGGESVAIITAARPAAGGHRHADLRPARRQGRDRPHRAAATAAPTSPARCSRRRKSAAKNRASRTSSLYLLTDCTRSAWERRTPTALAQARPRAGDSTSSITHLQPRQPGHSGTRPSLDVRPPATSCAAGSNNEMP